METSVLRYICAHEELASSSTSISVPLQSPTYRRLSVRVCPSCAIFIAEQALEGLESTFQVKRTGRSDWEIALAMFRGIYEAELVARANNMERAFCIAPTASCSYRSKDLNGFTCAPEIAPPISRQIDRDSGTFGVESYDYGNVEIASEVGWDAYKKVADQLMIMLNNTGLLHGYSFNSWSDVIEYDNEFVQEWLDSPQTSLYYSLQVMPDTQDKTDVYSAIDSETVDSYLNDILNKEPITCDCQE